MLLNKLLFRVFLIVNLVLTTFKINGQQTAQYSNFFTNSFYYNPSTISLENGLVFKTGHRSQWTGFNGAPKTTFASISSNIKKPYNKSIGNSLAFGGYFENDMIGPYKRSSINFAFSYNLLIQRNLSLAFGLFSGFQQFGLDATKINLNQASDPLVIGSGKMFVFPDFSVGTCITNKIWYVAISAKQMFNPDWNDLIGSNNSVDQVHYHLMFGKIIEKEKFSLRPNVLISKTRFGNPELNLNLNVEFTDYFDAGLSLRNTNAVIALLNFKILNCIDLYYSYDLSISKLRNASINTHEIMLGIKTGMKNSFNSNQAKTSQFY